MSDWSTILGWLAVLGGFSGWVSVYIAWKVWKKAPEEIVMLTDSASASKVLPAWFIERMMNDDWRFGLLMRSGLVIVIDKITAVSSNGQWIDVELALRGGHEGFERDNPQMCVFAIGPERKSASLQVSNVIAVVEQAST